MDYWNYTANRNVLCKEDRFEDRTIREKLTIEQIEERLDYEKKKNHYLIMSNESLRKSNHQFANTYDDLKIQLSEMIQERNMLFQKNVAQSYLVNRLNEQLTSYKEILTKTSSKNKAMLVSIMSSYDELLMSTACLDKYISDIDQKTVKDTQNSDTNIVDLKLALGSPRWDKIFPINTVLSPVQEERTYHPVDPCNIVKTSRLGRNNLRKYDPNIPERLHTEEKLREQLWEKSPVQDVYDKNHSQWIYVDTEPTPTKMESPLAKSDREECLSSRDSLSNTPAVKRNSFYKCAHIGQTFSNDATLEKTFTLATQENNLKAYSSTPLKREINIYVDPDVPEDDHPHTSILNLRDITKSKCRNFFPPLDFETNFQPKKMRNELSYLDSNVASVLSVSTPTKNKHEEEDFKKTNEIISSEETLPVKCTPAKKASSSHSKNLRKVKKIISLKRRLSVEAKRNRKKSTDALSQRTSSPEYNNVTITLKPEVKKAKNKVNTKNESEHNLAEDKIVDELITNKGEGIEKDNDERREPSRMLTRSRRRKLDRMDNKNKENEIDIDDSRNRQARSRNVKKKHSSEDKAQSTKSRSKKKMGTPINCFSNNNAVNQIETCSKQSSNKENISTPKPVMDVSQPLCLNEFSISPIKRDTDKIIGDGEMCDVYQKRSQINSPDHKTPKKKIISLSDLVKKSGSKIQSKEDRALIRKFFARFGGDDKLLAGNSKEFASTDQRKIISSP